MNLDSEIIIRIIAGMSVLFIALVVVYILPYVGAGGYMLNYSDPLM